MSIFGEIPDSRICEDAAIKSSLCVCNKRVPLDVGDPLVQEALTFTIEQHINKDRLGKLPECVQLEVDRVLHAFQVIERSSAHDMKDGTEKPYTDVAVTFITKPGGGLFESYVRTNREDNSKQVMYPFYRMNMYYDTASCISDPNLRDYCYCKSNIIKTAVISHWSSIIVVVVILTVVVLLIPRISRRKIFL